MLKEKNVHMIETVLSRPAKYIGSLEKHTETLWVYENSQMIQRDVTYVPGLYKIFDEILDSAADNNPKMDCLKVHINLEDNSISVYCNTGDRDAIPVVPHPLESKKIYVPELIFGNFFGSTNYHPSDDKSRIQRPWLGAKLANMFSSEFMIETADDKSQYKQVFSDNMTKKSKPIISKCEDKKNWTKITFKPDLGKFGLTALNEYDVVALMEKRVIDIAGCLGKSVEFKLNKEETRLYHFESFSKYCQLYMKSAPSPGSELLRFEEDGNDRWQICITRSNGQFQQVSFVNSTATIRGGTHVDYVIDKITSHFASVINKKYNVCNGVDVERDVKNHLWVFVKALIHNPFLDPPTKERPMLDAGSFGKPIMHYPFFDSPTKERLILDAGSLGTFWDFTPKFLDQVSKSDIMKNIEDQAACKLNKYLRGRVEAWHQHASFWRIKDEECTLFFTQGDIAERLAKAGRRILGLDRYGVYPLFRKLLVNVKEASDDQIMQNAELSEIMYILGLKIGVKYDDDESRKSLKYRHVIIMTQNHDGSYIMGLLINLFHTFWPELLKVHFLHQFITPIIKAKHRDGKTIKTFYTMPQYEAWRESHLTEAKNWTITYYEGLESFTLEEAQEYFRELDKHKRHFVWENDEDGKAIELAFSKEKIEDRRNWLQKFVRGTFLDPKRLNSRYRDFVNKELVNYFIKDHEKSIPSIVDGLKSGEREILLYLFKNHSEYMIPVEEISGYLSRLSPFFRKDKERLDNIVIGMAQDFVGSNNINLLLSNSLFGGRDQGGKDHPEPVYLKTNLSPLAKFLFHKEEDLFTRLVEDEQSVLHNCYVPIIPMVLVNGSEGKGSLWSSSVPKYNPLDIIANIKLLLKGGGPNTMVAMQPWYKGFMGSIQKNPTEENSFTTSGLYVKHNDKTFEIKELPIGMWIDDCEKILESVDLVQEFCNKSSRDIVNFSVTLSEKGVSAVKNEGFLETFNLINSVGTSNMHLFDSTGVIKKYDTPEEILQEFFYARLKIYEERKEFASKELRKCQNNYNYIKCVMDGGSNKEKADLLHELRINRSDPLPEKKNDSEISMAGLTDDDDKESVENDSADIDYLLSLNPEISTLEKLQAQKEELEKLVEYLQPTNVKLLWKKNLNALEQQFKELVNYDEEQDHRRKKEPSEKNPQKKVPSENTRTETGLYKRRGRPASEQSPHIKLRKLRSSPFNRKSGSIPGRTINSDDEEDASEASTSNLGNASDAAEPETVVCVRK